MDKQEETADQILSLTQNILSEISSKKWDPKTLGIAVGCVDSLVRSYSVLVETR